jgi:hypothetical protein
VVEPVTGHPAADRATPEALLVEQARAVVGLSSWLADAALTAVATNRLLQVLTPAESRISYPLELLFGEGGSQWVVRDGDGHRDGFLGLPVAWNGSRFAPVDGPALDPAPADPAEGSLELQITTVHPATTGLRLGASTVAAARALTGADPLGWGTSEPATQPWSPAQLTELCRDRAPEPTALVVVGGEPGRRVVGRIRVSRVGTGVLEEVRLAGPAARAVAQDAVDELVENVAGSARSMIVSVHPTRSDATRPSRPSPPAVPYGVLIGPEVVTGCGVDHAQRAPAASVRVLGRRSGDPACWCRLDGDGSTPGAYAQLGEVLRHFDLRSDALR